MAWLGGIVVIILPAIIFLLAVKLPEWQGDDLSSEQVSIAAGPASVERASVGASPPNAVPAPQRLEQDEIAMEGNKNPTAGAEQHRARTHQKRVASKATVPMPRKKPVKASARWRARDTAVYADQQQDVQQPSNPTQTWDDQDITRVSIDAQGRSEPVTEATDLIGQEHIGVAAAPGNKTTLEASDKPSPEYMRQSQCDYRGCASAYRSFRASDCTYQPRRGRRRLCEKGGY